MTLAEQIARDLIAEGYNGYWETGFADFDTLRADYGVDISENDDAIIGEIIAALYECPYCLEVNEYFDGLDITFSYYFSLDYADDEELTEEQAEAEIHEMDEYMESIGIPQRGVYLPF